MSAFPITNSEDKSLPLISNGGSEGKIFFSTLLVWSELILVPSTGGYRDLGSLVSTDVTDLSFLDDLISDLPASSGVVLPGSAVSNTNDNILGEPLSSSVYNPLDELFDLTPPTQGKRFGFFFFYGSHDSAVLIRSHFSGTSRVPEEVSSMEDDISFSSPGPSRFLG